MKKPSSKIREEIARLQDQLKAAETREAERIGRIALKAGLGEIEIEEGELQAALEAVAARFRGEGGKATGRKEDDHSTPRNTSTGKVETGTPANGDPET